MDRTEFEETEKHDKECTNKLQDERGDGDHTTKLKRSVGLISGTALVMGNMIGGGIFILPKGVIAETGSVSLSLIVWAAAGFICLLGALSYIELENQVKKCGGEYAYLNAAMGRLMGFMFVWTKLVVLVPSDLAITTLTFAHYTVALFPFCGVPDIPLKIVAASVIVTVTIINCYDTKTAAYIQIVVTAANLVAFGIIIIGGIVVWTQGKKSQLDFSFDGTKSTASRVALAFYDTLWAYEGWNSLNYITDEMENPKINLPRATIFGVLMVTTLYVLTNLSYVLVLGMDGVIAADVVAETWGEHVLGSASYIIPVCVLFISFASANSVIFSGARPVFVAARDDIFPEVLSYISCKRRTPLPSLILSAIFALLMLIPSDLDRLINFFGFASWLFYSLSIVALFILRWKSRHTHKPGKVNTLISMVFFMCSSCLVILPIIQDPSLELLYAFLFILGGLAFYIPFVHFKIVHGQFDPVTRFLQKLMEVVPCQNEYHFD